MATALDSFDTGVVNGALALIGQPPIASLTGDFNAARVAREWVLPTLDALLAQHSWNFAETSFSPSAAVPTPDARGFWAFGLPAECIQIVRVSDLDADDWRVVATLPFPPAHVSPEGRFLLARAKTPYVTATWRVMNAGSWSALFREAYEVKLAAALAPALAREAGRGDDLKAELRALLMTAKRRDAQEGARRQVPYAGSWLESRYGRRVR